MSALNDLIKGKGRFKWTSSSWNAVSTGLGVASTGLALTGFGAPVAGITSAFSAAAGLKAKDAHKNELKDSIRDNKENIRNDAYKALRSTSVSSALSTNTALNAYRAGEYDVGRKIKARAESLTLDRIGAINRGYRNAINVSNQNLAKVKGIQASDIGIAAGKVALSFGLAGANRADSLKKIADTSAAQKVGQKADKLALNKSGLSSFEKIKALGIRKSSLDKLSSSVDETSLSTLISKFQKTKESYESLKTAGKFGLYGIQTTERY